MSADPPALPMTGASARRSATANLSKIYEMSNKLDGECVKIRPCTQSFISRNAFRVKISKFDWA